MPKINFEKITNGAVKTAGIVASLAVAGAITLFSAALMKASVIVLFKKEQPQEVKEEKLPPKPKKNSPKKEESKGNKA